MHEDQQAVVADIEERAKALGILMRDLCREAGVHPTTVSRWKASAKRPKPFLAKYDSLQKLWARLAELEAEQAAA